MLDSAWLMSLRKLAYWGVDRYKSTTEGRRILLSNIAAGIGIVSLVLFDISYLLSGNPTVMQVPLLHLPSYLGFVLIPWLNLKGRHLLACWLLTLFAMWAPLAPMVVALGTLLNFHHYFILFAVVPVAFFPERERLSVVLIFLVNTALFIWFELFGMPPIPELQQSVTEWIVVLRSLFAFMLILTIATFFWIYDHLVSYGEQELERISMIDSLTGMPNRRFLEKVFHQEVAQCTRSKSPLAMAIMDIDFFKRVNDSYGHDVGDEVLKCAAQLVQRGLRANSVIARVGGEEFEVLLPATSLAQAVEVMERVRQAFETNVFQIGDLPLKLTISIGVAAVNCAAPMEEACKMADLKLYEAKHAGRNQVKF